MYEIMENNSIQLNHVAFTRRKLEKALFWIKPKSRAIIQSNILIENYVSGVVYASIYAKQV